MSGSRPSADLIEPITHRLGFVKKAGLVKDGTPDEFEELAGRCAVFRLDPSC